MAVNRHPRLLGKQDSPPNVQHDEVRPKGKAIRSFGRVPAVAYYEGRVGARYHEEESASVQIE